MKHISKHFKSATQAENYLFRLYSNYSSARLIRWPYFSEAGNYIFEVN